MGPLKQFLYLLFLLGPAPVISQNCIVKGTASDYAGYTAPVYSILNPFNNSRLFLDTIQFTDKGQFEISFPVQNIRVVYFDLGRFTGYLYAEPGYSYELLLPPFIERTHQNNINPFYKQAEVHLKVIAVTETSSEMPVPVNQETNNILLHFDTIFNRRNEEILIRRQNNVPVNADSVINLMEEEFSAYNSPLHERYRRYRYGLLKINEGRTGLAALSSKFLYDRMPELSEPAYMDLFNAIFDDFLVYYSRTADGKDVADAINRKHSLHDLKKQIMKHPAIFSDTIADMVILKELSGQYYENYFIKDAILIILDSMASGSSVAICRSLAGELHDSFSRLMIGNTPPDFRLRDQSGKYRSASDFAGKYVYLFFCTPDNYSCMSEYPFLESFYQNHKDYLEIVTIMVSGSFKDMVSFMTQNQYDWTALYYNDQPDILTMYNVKYFPTAFLLDPYGKLVQSPATLPSEGFQQQLFRIMRSKGEI